MDDAALTALVGAASASQVRAALGAALGCHLPERGDWGISCSCWDRGGSRRAWPCPEVLAITRALTGEEKTDE